MLNSVDTYLHIHFIEQCEYVCIYVCITRMQLNLAMITRHFEASFHVGRMNWTP